jgi:hypothetical protein
MLNLVQMSREEFEATYGKKVITSEDRLPYWRVWRKSPPSDERSPEGFMQNQTIYDREMMLIADAAQARWKRLLRTIPARFG